MTRERCAKISVSLRQSGPGDTVGISGIGVSGCNIRVFLCIDGVMIGVSRSSIIFNINCSSSELLWYLAGVEGWTCGADGAFTVESRPNISASDTELGGDAGRGLGG